MKNIIDALEWRYAVKKFNENATLSKAQLDQVYKAFNLSASSYGLQPYKLVVIQDKALQERLMLHSYGQQQIKQASAVLVFCVRTDFNEAYIDDFFKTMATQRNVSASSLEGYKNFMKGSFANKSSEEILVWATKQTYLAMGNLLASCAALEIDACPMEGFNPQGYNQELNLEEKGLEAVLIMPIGQRASDDLTAGLTKVRQAPKDIIIAL